MSMSCSCQQDLEFKRSAVDFAGSLKAEADSFAAPEPDVEGAFALPSCQVGQRDPEANVTAHLENKFPALPLLQLLQIDRLYHDLLDSDVAGVGIFQPFRCAFVEDLGRYLRRQAPFIKGQDLEPPSLKRCG